MPAHRKGGRIVQQLLAKMWQFPFTSFEGLLSVHVTKKIEDAVKNLENSQLLLS
jgi:hypothetical protein